MTTTEPLPRRLASGLEYLYLEQDGNYTHGPIKSAAETADYFKKHLQDIFDYRLGCVLAGYFSQWIQMPRLPIILVQTDFAVIVQ